MPMSSSLADAGISPSENTQAEQAMAAALEVAERLRRELDRLVQENLSLRAEIVRLAEDNEDLRGSAKIWLRLYEGGLSRSSRAVSKSAAVPRLTVR